MRRAARGRDDAARSDARHLPAATVARLPRYLEALTVLAEAGTRTVSSPGLAARVGLNPAQVRKDLSHLGSRGTRGVGYDVVALSEAIAEVLGLTTVRRIVIVGIGNLGTALASYAGFGRRGFEVAALVDADPTRIGADVAGHEVADVRALPVLVRERGLDVAVLAVPGEAAATAAATVVSAGIRVILNFSPAFLDLPPGVAVRDVDLSTELRILSFYGSIVAGEVGPVGPAGVALA